MASQDLDTELDEQPIDIPHPKTTGKPKVVVNKWDPENLDEGGSVPAKPKKKVTRFL
jgi:hypothetical protein